MCQTFSKHPRSGSAVPELAILLPFLLFSGLVTTDFARVFQNLVTITDCARAGAVYASDPSYALSTTYESASEAALAGAGGPSPVPAV